MQGESIKELSTEQSVPAQHVRVDTMEMTNKVDTLVKTILVMLWERK